MEPVRRIAIVIEPRPVLADLVAEALQRMGYEVATAATHAGGAIKAAAYGRVDLGVAAVPALGEERRDSYLLEARNANDRMCMIVMLSDPTQPTDDAPPSAETIVKPFGFDELRAAVERATNSVN